MKLLGTILFFSYFVWSVENGLPLSPEWNNSSPAVEISSGEPGNPIEHCTGVMIAPRVVLTAAHCLHSVGYIRRIAIEHLESGIKRSYSFRTIVKSGYNSRFHDFTVQKDIGYDIALIVLRAPVSFAYTSVDLAESEPDWGSILSNVWLLGMGGQRPRYDSASSLPIGNVNAIRIPNKPLFYSYQSAKVDSGVCEGDSGGGIFARQSDRWVLIGIQSSKTADAQCRGESNFGYFVPVFSNLDWINAALKGVQN